MVHPPGGSQAPCSSSSPALPSPPSPPPEPSLPSICKEAGAISLMTGKYAYRVSSSSMLKDTMANLANPHLASVDVILLDPCGSPYVMDKPLVITRNITLVNDLINGVAVHNFDCSTPEGCQAAVEAQGLTVGGGGYSFAGDWVVKGCYAYYPPGDSGYSGMAYFGTGGTQEDMNEPLQGEGHTVGRYRPCANPVRENITFPDNWKYVVLDANATQQSPRAVIEVAPSVSVKLVGLEITGGAGPPCDAHYSTWDAFYSSFDPPGGIDNHGSLTVQLSSVRSNLGTGIRNAGSLWVIDSEVSVNTGAWTGAGISNNGRLAVTNSKIVGNVACYAGGGILHASNETTRLIIMHSSISE
jgi:hypothetical protein